MPSPTRLPVCCGVWGMEPEFMMTGGVAKNPGVVRAVEEKIGSKLYICEEPEIVGAAGAAIYALEKMDA